MIAYLYLKLPKSEGFEPKSDVAFWRANPDEETTDWRAVCGRTACTVRRAGRVSPFPTPIILPVFKV